MRNLKLISIPEGFPVIGEATGLRERSPNEVVHLWKDKEEDQAEGQCNKCGMKLGYGPPWLDSEDKWQDHPAKCNGEPNVTLPNQS